MFRSPHTLNLSGAAAYGGKNNHERQGAALPIYAARHKFHESLFPFVKIRAIGG
jgi:hypothetical protein